MLHIETSLGLRIPDLEQLQEKVRLQGGRLVVYLEVLSAVFISARSYRVRWVSPAAGRVACGFPSSLISALLGWWAIFGPFWTVLALIWNGRGGLDLTDGLMRAEPGSTQFLAYPEMKALSDIHDRARIVALWIVWSVILGLIGWLGFMVWKAA